MMRSQLPLSPPSTPLSITNRSWPARIQCQRANRFTESLIPTIISRPQRLERVLIRLKSSGKHLPQSLLGIAIDYALGQWQTLDVYLGDGRVEIDNNLVENAIRPTALGKKNCLFMGDADAGERGAIIYTVIESCRRRVIDPYAYLKDLLTRPPTMANFQIPDVTPAAWAKARLLLQRQAASYTSERNHLMLLLIPQSVCE
jgi:hypothetical protein